MGSRLEIAIKDSKIPKKELARVLGKTTATVSHYCNNKREPSIATLNKIMSILGLPSQYFFNADSTDKKYNTRAFIPIIKHNQIDIDFLSDIFSTHYKGVFSSIDSAILDKHRKLFAVKMVTDSLAPKFSKGSTIFFSGDSAILKKISQPSYYLIKRENRKSVEIKIISKARASDNYLIANQNSLHNVEVIQGFEKIRILGKIVLSFNKPYI